MNTIIFHQDKASLGKLKYGFFPMTYNGCEIIATHNTLCLLGYESSLEQMRSLFYKARLCSWFGLWGSKVSKLDRIQKFLTVCITPVSLQFISSMSNGVYIISFWNKKAPWHGIHTVACEVNNHQYKTYNLYKGISTSPISPEEYAGSRFICAYAVIKKES